MANSILLGLAAITAMVPSAIVAYRRPGGRDRLYWLLFVVAIAGPTAVVAARHLSGGWETSFSMTLWVTISVSLVLFAGLVVLSREGWKLTVLVMPSLIILGVLALFWQAAPGTGTAALPSTLGVHIVTSVVTFSLVTLAAIAALSAFLRERALKRKTPTRLSKILPSVVDSETLLVRVLLAGEVVLALGLVTGFQAQYAAQGELSLLDHKTLLSLAAFVVIGVLLAAHFVTGVRGKLAARFVLVAFLLMYLAYPGVKFVTDILLARG